MEIKATLQKPYEEKDRLDFIVEQNHQNGYEIKETEIALEAWGLTAEEQEEKDKVARKAKLIAELDEIDLKEIRPIAAKAAGIATAEDEEKLAEYEEQKVIIRQQIKDLGD